MSYTLSKVIGAEPAKYNNNNSNSHSKFNNANTNSTNSYNTDNTSSKFTPYNNNPTDVILKLDPAFDELLAYPECEELVGRHVPVVPEMRQVLYAEQRKYSIQIKVSLVCISFLCYFIAVKLLMYESIVLFIHRCYLICGCLCAQIKTSTIRTSYFDQTTQFLTPPQASKLAGETSTTTKPATTSATTSANKLDTESTPYLIMQQQQKDSSLTKRQHSGALEGFFTVS